MTRFAQILPLLAVVAAAPLRAAHADPTELARGRVLYLRACATCHGAEGRGDGPTARTLAIAPRNLTLGMFRFRMTPSGALPTDEDLLRSITYGLPGTEMPGWERVLPESDRRAVVAYIKTLTPRFAAEPAGEMIRLPAPAADNAAVRELGRTVYQRMQCAACHGAGGRGDGPSMPGLRDEEGRPLPAADLTRQAYKGGTLPTDVERDILTGLDGAAMPSYAGAVSDEEVAALARYVLSLRRPRGLLGWLTEVPR